MARKKSEIEKLNMTMDLSTLTTYLDDLQRRWSFSTIRQVSIREGRRRTVATIDKLFEDLREEIKTLK